MRLQPFWSQYLTIFRLICIQTDDRLVPNKSKNGKYNLISVWFNKISKRYLCEYFTLASTAVFLSKPFEPRPGIRTLIFQLWVPWFYPLGHCVLSTGTCHKQAYKLGTDNCVNDAHKRVTGIDPRVVSRDARVHTFTHLAINTCPI